MKDNKNYSIPTINLVTQVSLPSVSNGDIPGLSPPSPHLPIVTNKLSKK